MLQLTPSNLLNNTVVESNSANYALGGNGNNNNK